ncbi:MAG: nucleotidyltransferase family protein [Phocaeicola sp.]|uniref:nucleotidyltransferase family protein n=1 Tax=Phocaeicola sp. TaxID=2773926 RepID=UPI003FA058F1
MKAMIFAAGVGSRLKPLTDYSPKALIKIAGQPMLEHVINKLKISGFDEIVINVHHLAEQIIDYLKDNNNFGITIHISDERQELLETGGGLQKALPLFAPNDEGILIHNVDILSNCDLRGLMQYHKEHQAVATLVVSSRKTLRYLLFNKENRLCGWVNKKTGETKPEGFVYKEGEYAEYAYAGIEVVQPEIYKWLPEGKFSIIDFYLNHCNELAIKPYVANDLKLLDIGKPETLIKAEQFVRQILEY